MDFYYAVYVRHELYDLLRSASRTDRNRIVGFIESLGDDPFQHADYTQTDESGRPYLVKTVGKYAVYFYVDHAAKEVKILDLIDSDTV